MMPPTPLQNSYASFEVKQENLEVEDQMWSARDRVVIAKSKQYLENESIKVGIEELESQLGPDGTDVDFRRRSKGRKKAARYLRPSAQMVQVHSWQSVVLDGTKTQRG